MIGQPEAEAGARAVASAVGVTLTTEQIQVAAAAFLGFISMATNAAWQKAEAAGDSAAAGVTSIEDAVKELSK